MYKESPQLTVEVHVLIPEQSMPLTKSERPGSEKWDNICGNQSSFVIRKQKTMMRPGYESNENKTDSNT